MSESTKSDQPSANSSCGYHSLPGELRSLIYKQVLVPGHVWIRPPPLSKKATLHTSDKICLWLAFLLDVFATYLYRLIRKISASKLFAGWLEPHVSIGTQPLSYPVKKKPCTAYQLLATCKQARDEGSAMFYSQNRFHLPPGPVEISHTWLESLRTKDQALLNLIVLDLSFLDLEPHIVDIIYIKAILKSLLPFSRPMPEIWISGITNHLIALWTTKAVFLERWQANNGRIGTESRYEVLRAGWRVGAAIPSRLRCECLQDTRQMLRQREHRVIGRVEYKMRL